MNPYYRFAWVLACVVSRIVFGRRLYGMQNVPKSGGAIIACNHCSLVDPPLIGSSIWRRMYFFAKEELFGKWYSPILIEPLNTIPVKRHKFDRAAYRKSIEVLRSGDLLLVFPEGTRSRDGVLREGRPGAAKMAMDAGVPIVPACIKNSHALKAAIFRKVRIHVNFGQPIDPSTYKHIENDKEKIRLIMRDVMAGIADLLKAGPNVMGGRG